MDLTQSNENLVPCNMAVSKEGRAIMQVVYLTAPIGGSKVVSVAANPTISIPENAAPFVVKAYDEFRAASLARKLQPFIELCYMGLLEQRTVWPEGEVVEDEFLFYLTEFGAQYCQMGWPFEVTLEFPVPTDNDI